jgi:hypothetical protein
MVSSLAAVVGVVGSAITFWKSFSKIKENEQIKIAHEIGNNLFQAENIIKVEIEKRNTDQIKIANVQYLNVWDWFSFLINKEYVTSQEIINYHKPTMLRDYDVIFGQYPDLKVEGKFEEFRKLCENWKSQKPKRTFPKA